MDEKIPNSAYNNKLYYMWSLKSSSESLLLTNKEGTRNPTAAPRAYEATAIVIAATISLSPNHTAASLAGAFSKKG